MNKTEWDAMIKKGIGLDRNRPADVKVAKIVMGWEAVAGNKYFKTLDGQLILQQRFRPTTDRNACALVLDEIKKIEPVWNHFCWRLLVCIHDRPNRLPAVEYSETEFKNLRVTDAAGFMDKLLCADPDLICYCAAQAMDINA